MTEKHRKHQRGGKKDDAGRGGYRKSYEYEEHEFNKHGKNEYLHVQHLSDIQEEEEEEKTADEDKEETE